MDSLLEIKLLGDTLIKIDSIYDQYARTQGVSSTALRLLYILSDSEVYTQKQICEQMLIPKQTLNSIVRDYKKDGLLEVIEQVEDKRHKAVRLTEKGKDYASKILPPVIAAETYSIEQFTSKEREMLLRLMERYASSFGNKLL